MSYRDAILRMDCAGTDEFCCREELCFVAEAEPNGTIVFKVDLCEKCEERLSEKIHKLEDSVDEWKAQYQELKDSIPMDTATREDFEALQGKLEDKERAFNDLSEQFGRDFTIHAREVEKLKARIAFLEGREDELTKALNEVPSILNSSPDLSGLAEALKAAKAYIEVVEAERDDAQHRVQEYVEFLELIQ